tara:strand:- start:632 stop:862 length:231 start_codon:yes stop_codon:yes gene_type:complete
MLHGIKCRIAKYIGRTIEECREAFEEGQEQGRILAEKYKAKEDSNKVAEPTEEAYDEYSQTHTAYRDDEPATNSVG